MLPPFDIFRVKPDGTTLWVEAADTLDAAKGRVEELLKQQPKGEFWIFSQRTQNKLSVKAGEIQLILKTEEPSEDS